jgi:outer membrane lipoprotein-sorting protein
MKRISILTTAIVTLAIATALPLRASAVAGDAELNRILAKMEAAGKSIKSFQANIQQEKYDKTIASTDRSSGTILYKAGTPGNERVLLDYVKPAPQTISVVGDKVTIYQPKISQAYVTTRQKQATKNTSLSFLTVGYNQAGSQLRERYVITLLGPETVGSFNTTLLQFKPKQPTANGPRNIQVWVDNNTGLPVKYVLFQENEKTTVTLSNVQTNLNLPDSKFDIKLPSGVRTVEG